MNHRLSTQLSILRSSHFRPLEPMWPGTSSAGGFLIVVPEMENAAAAGRAQHVRLEFRKVLPGAILSQPTNRGRSRAAASGRGSSLTSNSRTIGTQHPTLMRPAVDPLSGSEDQIRPRRRSSVPAVHPGAAEPLLTRLNPGKMAPPILAAGSTPVDHRGSGPQAGLQRA
jgi:hypothetical protein